MKIYCISDNVDTKVGMRLAGIDGEVIHDDQVFKDRVLSLTKDKDIAIILITEKLIKNSVEFINEIKLSLKQPIIVEIPDRHATYSISESISDYINQAVGIKL